MAKHKFNSGFTLIEVVLVLALAGLLMVAVFLAVSGAQKSRRDFQRKHDAALMVAAVEAWRSNNVNNNLDSQAELDGVGASYLQLKDPETGLPYVLQYFDGSTPHVAVTAPPLGHMSYVVEHRCGSDAGAQTYVTDDPNYVHGIRQFAVLVTLETGDVYCTDNH
jgi:prepilin-type N-terminal cleavage/methylation domain-containing protein